MDVKWFFAIIGIILAFAILSGVYFLTMYVTLKSEQNYENAMNQSKTQFEKQLNQTTSNFNRSILIHDVLYNNITDITKGLKPILAVIPNATQSEEERKLHYNQTATDFETIKEIMEIKVQDHETLNYINKSLAVIAGIENISSSTNTTVIDDDNSTTPILSDCDDKVIIENITGKDLLNKLSEC